MSRILYKLDIPLFKTHVKQSKTKYKKINGQSIYTGSHHRVRQIFMEQIHGYLKQFIKPQKEAISIHPLELKVEVHAPINYGNVKRIRGKLSWKPAKEGYEPTWDLDNFSWIWVKGIQDVLQRQNVIIDDTVKYIRKVEYEFIPIENLEDRKLTISLSKSDTTIGNIWKKFFKPKKETENGGKQQTFNFD
jgi:Holliday junction resolvase RusA-like endonuclease